MSHASEVYRFMPHLTYFSTNFSPGVSQDKDYSAHLRRVLLIVQVRRQRRDSLKTFDYGWIKILPVINLFKTCYVSLEAVSYSALTFLLTILLPVRKRPVGEAFFLDGSINQRII